MKYNKQSAFTLAEVLVLLLTITILIAAFAPVFTKRYTNQSASIWKFVPGDENQDAYFDSFNRSEAAQAFVGLSPLEGADVPLFLNYNDSEELIEVEPVYSKLVIHASKNLDGNINKPQQQMQFRYVTADDQGNMLSSPSGELIGSLFAGNGNMLVGGPFSNIKNDALGNTYYVSSSQSNIPYLISSGTNNTALGANALRSISTGSGNTAVGTNDGYKLIGDGNTLAGTYTGQDMGTRATYNTIIGGYVGPATQTGRYIDSSFNTAVGHAAMSGCSSSAIGADGIKRCIESKINEGGYNTAVGYYALSLSTGKGNTALGAYSASNLVAGDYNTAIGYNSCSFLGKDEGEKALSKVTCIGANSGATLGLKSPNGLDVDAGHVYIGGMPNDYAENTDKGTAPRAVLEVHNTDTTVKTQVSADLNNATGLGNIPSPSGHESVVINGNLIVRGQTYLEVPLARPTHKNASSLKVPKGLVLFRLVQNSDGHQVFSGYDGVYRGIAGWGDCRGRQQRAFNSVATSCICTAVGDKDMAASGNVTSYGVYTDSNTNSYTATPSYSYDWNSRATGLTSAYYDYSTASYVDQATGKTVTLIDNSSDWFYSAYPEAGTDRVRRYVDFPLAHMESQRCCPDLTSDIRLKNVGEKFVAGLDEIRKINVYNFTFKTDKNRVPQVGVIAQDLKRVFPNAVSKDEKGYYQIRWDEMLYAAINAIKTLNSKVEKLADKIATDKERIANLKADNAKMYAQLDKLAEELDQLEAKSRK